MENTRPFHSFHIRICLIPPSPFMRMRSWPTHSGTVDSKAVHICHWMIAVGMVALSRKAWSNYILLSISHTLGLGGAYQLVNNLFTCCGQAEMLCINPETHQRNHTHTYTQTQFRTRWLPSDMRNGTSKWENGWAWNIKVYHTSQDNQGMRFYLCFSIAV